MKKIYFLFLCCLGISCKLLLVLSEQDLKNAHIYGLGLEPNIYVFPVRYFYIELNGNSSGNYSNVDDTIKVQVEGDTADGRYCRVWTQVLNRSNGKYIARYRVYETCFNAKIYVLLNGAHLDSSPYEVKGPIYPESCYCPVENTTVWMDINKCPSKFSQIDDDLRYFINVDMNEVFERTWKKFGETASRSYCHYVIKSNKIFRSCFGQHVGFKMFMDNILLSVTRKVMLPDIEFIVNLGDWPLTNKNDHPLIPIFSWCGSKDTADIVMPTYDMTESTLEMMGRVTVDVLSVLYHKEVPWQHKEEKAFWRGRDSRRERLDLIDISRESNDLINASITNFFFFRDLEEDYGPKAKHASFFDFFNYKYQLSIDGTVAAYRFPYLLAGGSLVFKQDSDYYEHYYNKLVPYEHYIPFKRDLSDVIEKINWAIQNDEKAYEISQNARKFALEHLLPQHIYCYYVKLFQAWSKLLTSKVTVRPMMEAVTGEENEKRFGKCPCHLTTKHDEL